MAFIIGLYLVADVIQHKGLTRVLLPKTFPAYKTDTSYPQNKNILINKNKEWIKAVDSKELLSKLDSTTSGMECDVYFDLQKKIFDVHHDINKSIGLNLDDLLNAYNKKSLQASIWLDLKNLDDSNYNAAVATLTDLRNKYRLINKLLVESNRADLLTAFSDSGFYTSYYTPMFNPYQINDEETKHWVDSLSAVINRSGVNALSGYYFQYPFLHHYFPNYPVLIWSANDRLSLVNWLFKKKIAASKEVFIALYP
ncbi:MAG: hypothetical protein ABI666_04575 [Ferruginibacter sp.]